MNFRTRIDFTNRQAKQYEKTDISLSGSSIFGLPYSALTSGPNLTLSAITYEDAALQSTYSGNTGTTVYTFSDSRMTIDEEDLVPLTPSNSGTTQYAGPTWAGYDMFTTVDGYTGWTSYSAVTYDIVVVSMVDLGGGAYSGIVQSDFIVYSAETLDYSGRTIWVDVSGITRTNDLIVTNTPVIGYVLTCYDNEGKATWQPTSGGTTGATIWTAGTGTGSAVLAGSDGVGGGVGAVSEGFNTVASGRYSHSEGHMSRAAGDSSHAEGGYSTGSISGGTAIGDGSHAEGGLTIASGTYSHAEGYQTSATTTHTHAEGYQTLASADASHAEGYQTSATTTYAHSEGYQTLASADASHAEGYESIAGGAYSHAEGFQTTASNVSSHAEGRLTTASGAYSHSEGYQTFAINAFTHAEGSGTTASGSASHAEGSGTTASGNASHAGGAISTASGITSFVHSYNSSANANNSAILGGSDFLIDGGSINSILLGGSYNIISGSTTYSGIICGFDHVLSGGSKSLILGGDNNRMNSSTSIIVGGSDNQITNGTGDTSSSFIGGGSSGLISDAGATLIGGFNNRIMGSSDSAIIGGADNLISGGSTNIVISSSGSTIYSGVSNSVIIGGVGFSATSSNMVYVPDLIIDGLTSTDPIATDSRGKIVAGASDIRLKENIKDLTSALEKVLKLRGVSYEWTEESNMGAGVTKFGLIAQEVQEIIPEMVRVRSKGDGMLSLSYTEIVPWLIEAIKELAGQTAQTAQTKFNSIIETQIIASEDNNIDLNYNGNHDSAIGGGITVLNAVSNGVNSEIKTDKNGKWIVTPALSTTQLSLPEYTPKSTEDKIGDSGDMVWDDNYVYVKTNGGWKRSSLENF